jgi:Bacterial Ig domain
MKPSQKKYLAAVAILGCSLFSGCGSSSNDFVGFGGTTVTPIQPILAAPVANDDNINALGNAVLNQVVSTGVLSNDQLNGGAISGFDATTTNGGTVVLNDDGSFTYTPAAGFTGTDTFTYTLANSLGNSTATVTLNVNGLGWFVNNSAASNGNGSQTSPFDNLPDAITASGSGDTIFVFGGTGTTFNGQINLPPGVDLIGQAAGLVLTQTIELPGARPTVTGPIVPEGDNTISGFTISGSANNGITASGITDLTVTNCVFTNPTNVHALLTDVSGNVTINNNTFNPIDSADYLDISNNGTDAAYQINGNTFADDDPSDPNDAMQAAFSGDSVISMTCNLNILEIDNAGFDDGFQVTATGTSTVTFNAAENDVPNCANSCIHLTGNGTSFTATLVGNVLNEASDGVLCEPGSGTFSLTATDNLIDRMSDGIEIVPSGASTTTAVLTGNRLFDCSECVVVYANVSGATVNVAVRNNSLFAFSDALDLEVDGANTMICADITGNSFETDSFTSRLTLTQSNSGVLSVERLDNSVTGGPIENANVFTDGPDLNFSGTLTPVNAGFCNIP